MPWGIYGIHGTNKPHSIGTDASHGCIRMFNSQVEELYELVKIGTTVLIKGHVLGEPHMERLAKGDRGNDVQLVQSRLRSAGFYQGPCDGRFGLATDAAVRAFEKAYQLPVDGVIGFAEYISLNILE